MSLPKKTALSLLFIFSVFSLSAHCTGIGVATGMEEAKYGFWKTFEAQAPGGRNIYRAAVKLDGSNDQATFAIGFYPENGCDPPGYAINVAVEKPLPETLLNTEHTGEIWVDTKPPHAFQYVIEHQEGTPVAFINAKTVDRQSQLLSEISNGNLIRFRLSAGFQDIYFRFPLDGAKMAIHKASLACRDSASIRESGSLR